MAARKSKKAEQNTVDIPEFLKPKEEQRGYLCKNILLSAYIIILKHFGKCMI